MAGKPPTQRSGGYQGTSLDSAPTNPPSGGSMVEPPPPLDYDGLGWAATGRVRVRTGWFGFAVVEELYVHNTNSTTQWRRLSLPREITR